MWKSKKRDVGDKWTDESKVEEILLNRKTKIGIFSSLRGYIDGASMNIKSNAILLVSKGDKEYASY